MQEQGVPSDSNGCPNASNGRSSSDKRDHEAFSKRIRKRSKIRKHFSLDCIHHTVSKAKMS